MEIWCVRSYCSCQETKVICVDNLGFIILGFFFMFYVVKYVVSAG